MPGDSRAFYPAFDADTLHYAARCRTSASLTLTPEDSDTRVSVNGVQRPTGAAFTLGGLHRETDIRITLTGNTGASTTYTVHCIDRGEFPKLTTVKRAGAMDDLLLFKAAILPTGQSWRSYLVLMDNNGVPRLRKRITDRVFTYFRVFPDETHPRARYGYFKIGSSHNPDGAELVVLDKYFNTVAEDIHILSPFSNTDAHDFMIRPNGDYVLTAYSPTRRDLRFINSEFPRVRNQQGGTLRRDQPVQDSVIQVRTADGTVKFNWNGWDHLAIEDCIIARNLSSGYAHINALGWIDGDVIAGFRGCSKILRIDLDTGNVVWRAGPSLRNRERWEAGETLQADRGPAPLDFVNDPAGGFSGQHGGQITADGHLLVYDNSTHCTTPPGVPVEVKGLKQCGRNTRAVAYAIDVANEELVFQREFRIPGSNYQGPSGHAEPMNNGDWLISWSNAAPPPNTAMQVDAETGTEKFSMTIVNIAGSDAGMVDNSRVLTVSPVALAARIEPLEATIASKPAFHGGTADRPVVVVAFNRPVVDVASATPSVRVTGATVAVAAHEEAGARANAYAFTLTPAGEGSIRFQLNADGACNSDAVCTADGAQLMTVPGELVIPGPVVVNFGAQTSVTEGGSVNVVATLNKAHGRGGDLAIPLRLGAGSTASAADVSIPESVSFDETETSKSVAVSAFNDALVEGAETAQLEFGTLPRGVMAGAATTVTIADATDDTLRFTVGATEVAEGNSTELVFAAGTGISFTTDQTISLTVDGTAAAGDYTLAAGGRTLAAPYTLELPAGVNSVSITLSVVNDTEEEEEELILVEATAGGESLGTRLIAVPANDRDLPDVSVSAGAGAITEGGSLAFTLRRTGTTADALTVELRVTETGAMLGATPPVSGTIPAGAATLDLSVTTENDSVVESDSEVTLRVTAGSSYEVGAPATATATVVDNDAASFTLTVAPLEIAEGGEADVTVSIDNGVTFAADQSIDIATEGTARLADSVLAVDGNALDPPYALTLAAGAMSTTAKLLAVDDDERESAETLTLAVRHGSAFIGRTTVTLAASDAPPQVSIAAAAAAVTEGDPVAFTLTRTRVTEPTRLPALAVPVTVLDPGRRLADAAPTEVTFAADATSTTLSLATTDDQVIPDAPAEVTATIVPPDGNGVPAYVVAGEPTARVSVTNDDEAEFALSVTPTEVAEGGRVTVTVTIENSVTFSETQTVTIFKEGLTGTAAAGVDYTVHAPNNNERDHLRLRRGRDFATGTIRVKYDAVAEGPETILIAAAHGDRIINQAPVTITIEANDGWSDPNAPPALAFAEVAGATLTLTFDHALDLASIPAATDFEVRMAGVPVSVDAVRVSGRTVVLTLESVPAHGQSVTVSYAPGNDRILDAQAGEAAGFAGVTVVETLVSIDPGRASEGDTVRFGVRLSQPVEDALTVSWRVEALTAEAGVDYPGGQTGMLTVPSGATTGEIAVSTTEDTERETNEKFVVLLEKPVGFPAWAGLAQSAAAGTIVDDNGGGSTGGSTGGGTGGGGGGGGGSSNRPPVVTDEIAAQVLGVGDGVMLDLSDHFRDPDRRAMTYEAESADAAVVAVGVDGEVLTARGVDHGVTTVTVTAVDHRRLRASQTFEVSVGYVVSFAEAAVSALEGGTARLPVTLSRARDAATTVAYVLGEDGDPSTADADARDHAGRDGTLTIPPGATRTEIAIAVRDDRDIEPPRETVVVTLLDPDTTEFGVGASTARVTINEGVCDRTRVLRNALRRSLPCASVSDIDLAERRTLDVSGRGLAALRSKDLSGLAGLETLDLSDNLLTELPAGVFAGLGSLREADLRGNPGAPFAVNVTLARTDAEPWAPSPATVAVRVREAAPFTLETTLAAENGTPSAARVSVAGGRMASDAVTMTQVAPDPVRVRFDGVPAVPGTDCGDIVARSCFQGLLPTVGASLVLFKDRPVATDAVQDQEVGTGGDSTRVGLSDLFEAPDGGALRYMARSSAPELVTATVRDGVLVLVTARDGREGAATITVTATDRDGLSTAVSFTVAVVPYARSWLTGWRRVLLDNSREKDPEAGGDDE